MQPFFHSYEFKTNIIISILLKYPDVGLIIILIPEII